MLRYNQHGGAFIRQSDLASWDRCQLQKKYRDDGTAGRRALSATVYGTVVHYCLLTLEKLHYAGKDNALDIAISTFEHYWHPENISLIAEPVDIWLPRQTYGGLRDRGRAALTAYYDLLAKDDGKLLALEYQFEVPLPVNGRLHTLTGTVDRLAVRKWYGTPYVAIEDFKTGKQPTYLRHNMQGTVYAYATLQPEFWTGENYPSFDRQTLDGIEHYFAKMQLLLHNGTKKDWWAGPTAQHYETVASRRFRWINLQDIKFADGGWRGPIDYQRMFVAVDAYVRAVEAEIYSPNLAGEVCVYCDYQTTCGGPGIPTADHGMPPKRWASK